MEIKRASVNEAGFVNYINNGGAVFMAWNDTETQVFKSIDINKTL